MFCGLMLQGHRLVYTNAIIYELFTLNSLVDRFGEWDSRGEGRLWLGVVVGLLDDTGEVLPCGVVDFHILWLSGYVVWTKSDICVIEMLRYFRQESSHFS